MRAFLREKGTVWSAGFKPRHSSYFFTVKEDIKSGLDPKTTNCRNVRKGKKGKAEHLGSLGFLAVRCNNVGKSHFLLLCNNCTGNPAAPITQVYYSQFLWVPGLWTQLSWVPCQSPSGAAKESAKLQFSTGPWCSLQTHQVMDRIQFLEVVGMTSPFSCWLLAGGPSEHLVVALSSQPHMVIFWHGSFKASGTSVLYTIMSLWDDCPLTLLI